MQCLGVVLRSTISYRRPAERTVSKKRLPIEAAAAMRKHGILPKMPQEHLTRDAVHNIMLNISQHGRNRRQSWQVPRVRLRCRSKSLARAMKAPFLVFYSPYAAAVPGASPTLLNSFVQLLRPLCSRCSMISLLIHIICCITYIA